jgi:hypothetical protein
MAADVPRGVSVHEPPPWFCKHAKDQYAWIAQNSGTKGSLTSSLWLNVIRCGYVRVLFL